jgi:hypothetical protein
VARALGLLLREVGRREQPPGVLVRAADVDQVLGADGLDDTLFVVACATISAFGLAPFVLHSGHFAVFALANLVNIIFFPQHTHVNSFLSS